jgi:uncharacterized repeat protein (TIGR01451 family)
MSQTRNGQGHAGRAAAWALLGAAALLVGTVMMGSAAFAADDPPTTLAADAPTTTVASQDPPVGPADVTGFTKVFAPNPITPGDTSTLTFTITSDDTGGGATALAFTDTLPTTPAAMTVAAPPNASTTCTGGTVTAVAGTGTISLADGAITGAASCTVTVDVTAPDPGTYDNTTDLSSGGTGTATGTLTVTPGFSKAFSPAQIDPSGVSTLTFTIDNTGNTAQVTGLDFSDTLPTTPAAMTVAATPNASKTCTGGTITADAGSGTISYTGGTVAADSTCTVQADVTAATVGTYDNTSGALSSSLGAGSTASATLAVTPLFVSKTFVEGTIASGGTATFNITVRNDSTTEALSTVALVDTLAPACDKTYTTLAIGETQTYTCSLANVTSSFTNTVTATATGASSGVAVTAQASALVTLTTPATPTAGPSLAITGGPKTTLLAGIGLGVLAFGALLVLGSSQRRRLARR